MVMLILFLLALNSCADSNLESIGDRQEKVVFHSLEQLNQPTNPTCENTLGIFSWNIFSSQPFDQVKAFLTHELSFPDIFSLQEVTEAQTKSLAQSLKASYYHAGNNGIISRYGITKQGIFTVNKKSGRPALYVEIDSLPAVRIYTVHLSYKVETLRPLIPKIREQEARSILDHAAPLDIPVLITGDMNSLTGLEPIHRETALEAILDNGFLDAFAYSPTATHLLLGRLDWIFYKDLDLIHSQVGSYKLSDHKWLLSEFCLH